MTRLPDAGSPLSLHRAFVAQLREADAIHGGHFTGRVEHVTSGQATWFGSVDELLAFIGRVLDRQRETSPASLTLIQRDQE